MVYNLNFIAKLAFSTQNAKSFPISLPFTFSLSQRGNNGKIERVVVGTVLECVRVTLRTIVSLTNPADLLLSIINKCQLTA